MMKMKKQTRKFLSMLLTAAMVLSLAACGQKGADSPAPSDSSSPSDSAGANKTDSSAAGDTVKLILYTSITGSGSTTGTMQSQAAQAAVDYVNSKGGIQSMNGAQVELVIVDSGSDTSAAALPLQRALQENPDAVAVIGHATSSICLVELEVLQEYEILGLTTSASNSAISSSGCEWVFQPAPYAQVFGAMQIEFLEYLCDNYWDKSLEELNIGLVYENSAWGTQNAEGTVDTLKEYGLKVAVDEPYEAGSLTDATSIITKMMNADVDVIFPSCYENDAKIIMTACQSLNYNPTILAGGSAFTWPSLARDLGDLVNGIYSTDNFVKDQSYAVKNEAFMELSEQYEKTYGDFLSGQGGPTAICTMLVLDLVDQLKTTDRTAIRDAVFAATSESNKWMATFNGENNMVDENGHNASATPIVLQWQNGLPTCVYPVASANSPIVDPNTLQPYQ